MNASGSVLNRQALDAALSDDDFNRIRTVIKDLTGINMSQAKKQLVYRRLSGRLRATSSPSFAAYLKLLKRADSAELREFTNAVTTNLTSFFRENHHFDFLKETFVPEILDQQTASGKRLRIWSAGCSTGEEPYSIAISLRESLREIRSWDAKVLCTDLDSQVLETCRRGIYAANRLAKMPVQTQSRWFRRNKDASQYRVRPSLQELLTFKQLNLMGAWPMRGKFDLIFCRNVIIYFDKDTQRKLVARFAENLKSGGYFVLGHSESLHGVSDAFTLLGQTIYRKNT